MHVHVTVFVEKEKPNTIQNQMVLPATFWRIYMCRVLNIWSKYRGCTCSQPYQQYGSIGSLSSGSQALPGCPGARDKPWFDYKICIMWSRLRVQIAGSGELCVVTAIACCLVVCLFALQSKEPSGHFGDCESGSTWKCVPLVCLLRITISNSQND